LNRYFRLQAIPNPDHITDQTKLRDYLNLE